MIHLYLVMKVSKLCNLRCTYCYETPELANRQKMSLDDIKRAFVNVKKYLGAREFKSVQKTVSFVWHGGEPFAQPLAYWQEILRLEDEVFGESFRKKNISNGVQTNLTLVTEKHLPLLRDGFEIGFSYDVINDLRVNLANKPTSELVEKKAAWLLKENIPTGGIVVVSKANVASPEIVAEYYLSRDMHFRLINLFFQVDNLKQTKDAAVPFEDYLEFCKKVYAIPKVKNLLETENYVEPLATALRLHSQREKSAAKKFTKQECLESEWALCINTNGDVYSVSDPYYPDYSYGNIFTKPISDLLNSPGRKKRMKRSEDRLKKICASCPFYKISCNGGYVSHATRENYRDYERLGGCEYALLAKEISPPSF